LRLERRADRLEPALGAVRVEPRRAEHRPAERQDVAHVRAGQVVHVTLYHAAPAVAESDARVPVRHPVLDDGPAGRVGAGDVASAGGQLESPAWGSVAVGMDGAPTRRTPAYRLAHQARRPVRPGRGRGAGWARDPPAAPAPLGGL